MAVTRGTISPAKMMEPGLRKIFMDAGEEFAPEYSQFCNMLTSQRRYEEDSEWVLLSTTPSKAEGATTTFDDPIVNENQKRYVHIAYGLATRMTHEAIQDELYNQLNKVPAALRRANDETVELAAMNLLINGFTSSLSGDPGDSSSTDINGEVLFHSTGHSKLDGTTYDANGVADAYSFTALQAMYDYFEGQTNDRGLRMRMVPGKIVLPYELRFTHREIWGSALKPFTADNTANSLQAEPGLQTVFSHYSSSSTAWWVFGNKADEHCPNFFWRESPSFGTDDDFLTGDVLAKTYMRFSLGMTKAVGAYGATGA